MAHEGYHEPVDKLTPETMDFHCAVVSLIDRELRDALFKTGPITRAH